MDLEKSSIERLKRTLYSRNEKIVPKEKRTPVGIKETDVPTDWGKPASFDISYENMTKKNNSFFNKFLIGSLIFFIISLGIALFIFFGGINMISSNNLDIVITAPSSVSSGEEFLMGLSVVNGNRTDLENVALFVNYPEGSEAVGGNNKTLTRERVDLGTIPKGGSKDYSIRALLFGEKDAVKTFTLQIEYNVKGSNAVFSKEKTYNLSIGSSPLLLNVDYPKEINSGQEVKLSIDITSNSSVAVKNSLVKVDYPYGFTYKSSNIKPLGNQPTQAGNSVWNMGDLKNGDKKTLTVIGRLVGQNMEDRSFRISAGTKSPSKTNDFDTTLAAFDATIGIRKSFFDLGVLVPNGGVAKFGQSVQSQINWQNTLPDKILNGHIEATISGNAFDRSSVSVGSGGFYRSADNTVLWDKNSVNSLAEMSPGEGGQFYLTLASIGDSQIRVIKNPHIDLHVVMTGDRSGIDSGTVSSSADITLKILSTLTLNTKSSRSVGPFVNSGPIPPHADKESTYTVTWTLTNTTNDLKDTVVSATLPPGVSWKGEIFPTGERLIFNPDTQAVSWNVGNIGFGTGFTNSAKEVSFKVGITPSLNQVSTDPPLTSEVDVKATDTYTETQISESAPRVTTQYSDPDFKPTDGDVVK